MRKIAFFLLGSAFFCVSSCGNALVHLSKKGLEQPDSPRVEETACQHYLFYFIPTHWQYMRDEWQPNKYKWLTDRSTEAFISLRDKGYQPALEDTDIIHYSYWWVFGYSSCEKVVLHLPLIRHRDEANNIIEKIDEGPSSEKQIKNESANLPEVKTTCENECWEIIRRTKYPDTTGIFLSEVCPKACLDKEMPQKYECYKNSKNTKEIVSCMEK